MENTNQAPFKIYYGKGGNDYLQIELEILSKDFNDRELKSINPEGKINLSFLNDFSNQYDCFTNVFYLFDMKLLAERIKISEKKKLSELVERYKRTYHVVLTLWLAYIVTSYISQNQNYLLGQEKGYLLLRRYNVFINYVLGGDHMLFQRNYSDMIHENLKKILDMKWDDMVNLLHKMPMRVWKYCFVSSGYNNVPLWCKDLIEKLNKDIKRWNNTVKCVALAVYEDKSQNKRYGFALSGIDADLSNQDPKNNISEKIKTIITSEVLDDEQNCCAYFRILHS